MQEAASPAGLSSVQRTVTLGRQQAGRGESLGRVARAPTRDTGRNGGPPAPRSSPRPGWARLQTSTGTGECPEGRGARGRPKCRPSSS